MQLQQRFLRPIQIIVLLALLLSLSAATLARAAAAGSIAPEAGAPGTTFNILVSGLRPDERVGSWLNLPDGSQIDATPYLVADSEGSVRWSWTAPADAPAGSWQAVTRGRDSGAELALPFTLAGSNQPPAVPPAVSGSVSPASGNPGATLSFSATGFYPRETVDFWASDANGTLRENKFPAQADILGNASWTYIVPSNAQPGAWTMTAVGRSSERALQIPFAVVLPANAAPNVTVSPASGGIGTTFAFSATGFRDRPENVDFWLISPEGQSVDGPLRKRSDAQGSVSWEWIAPEGAAGGLWQMIARGEKSKVERVIPFTILRDLPPPAAATATVSPENGQAGTLFSFSATGYREGERVGFWLNLPDGTVVRFDKELTANAKGEVRWTWMAPADAQLGLYTMAARSSQSDRVPNDVAHTLRFVVH